MTRRMRFTLAAVALAGSGLVVAGLSGCGRTSAAATPEVSAAAEPAVVPTVRPERQTIRRTVQQPGQIEGFEETPLFVKITGYVQKLHVDIGDRVRAGQVLAELWVPELEEEFRQKQAAETLAQTQITQARRALEAAEANLTKAEASLTFAKAGLTRAEASRTRWDAEYERAQRLLAKRAIDQQTVDQTLDQLRSSEAALAESKANIQVTTAALAESKANRDQAEANVQVARARLQVAEADRKRTAALLAYAMVKAPFDGVVSRRQVNTGHFVQPPTTGTANNVPLFVVTRTDPVRIFVDVPETDAGLVRDGTPARIRVQALQDQEFAGKVARSSWVLDNQARTLRAEIDLPNPNGLFRPGMYATAAITVNRPAAFTLPASAVVAVDDEPYVMRVANGKAVRTPVRLGSRQGPRVEVLQKQVEAARYGQPARWERFTGTEEVVLKDPAAWTDGQAVPGRAPRRVAKEYARAATAER